MGCCDARANGVPPADVIHTMTNVGTFAELYINGTGPDSFEFRTLQSSDASIDISQNAQSLDFQVTAPPTPAEVFQTNTVATLTTSSTTLTTLDTLTGVFKMLTGEEWKINMDVGVEVPSGLTGNAEQIWQIETSAGVFTEFDRHSIHEPLALAGSEQAWPQHRTKNLVASMDAPRMRIQVHRTAAGGSTVYWERPGWGGVQIAEAA